MKKVLLFSMLLISAAAFAQSPIGKGGRQINFGVGLSNHGVPVYINYDFGVHQDITVSPIVQFNLDGFDYLALGVKSDYHFNTIMNIPQNWDFYAGLNLGFIAHFDNEEDLSPLDLGFQIGGRYYWSDWGINLEFRGGSVGYGTLFGLSKRF